MRRKAEILQYSASKTNTKTNNLTRAERWALIVKGSIKQPTQSFIQQNIISQTIDTITIQTCPSGTIISTPSSASGVPGQITQLYLDPAVPLYNYATKQDNYSLLNSETNNQEFTYDSGLQQLDQKIYASTVNSIIATSIYIKNPVNKTRNFIIQFPISMFIKGTVRSDYLNNFNTPYKSSITVSMDNIKRKPITCNIQYGYSTVQNIIYDISFLNQKSDVTYDISMVPKNNISNNSYFEGNQYLGICTIKTTLNTQSGFIYDICLNSLDLNGNSLYSITGVDSMYSTIFNNPSYGIYVNVSKINTNQTINCSVKNPNLYPSISTILPLNII